MKGKELFAASLALMVTAACGATTIAPTNDAQVFIPTETPTPEVVPTIEYNSDLLNSQSWTVAINATAQALEEKGFEQLVKEGFPQVVLDSYSDITRIYTVKYRSNTSEYLFGFISSTPSTRIKYYSDGELYWVFLTAGHVLSDELAESDMASSMQSEQNDPSISTSIVSLDTLKLNGVDIDAENVGSTYLLNHTSGIRPDIGVISIPDKLLPEELRAQLAQQNTLEFSNLAFSEPVEGSKFYSICYPSNTGYKPTITTDAMRAYSDDKTRLSVDPSLIAPNCSGSGMFFRTPSGEVYYAGVNVEILPDNPQLNDDARVFPLYLLGENGLRDLIMESIENQKSK